MSMRNYSVGLALVSLLLLGGALSGCKVVSEQELAQLKAKGQRHGPDPVVTLETGVRPYARQHAKPLAEVLKALAADSASFDDLCKRYGFRQSTAFPCNFWVSVDGKVSTLDRQSRMAKAEVEVDGVDDTKVAVLLGPVLVGTGVRDGFPGVKYSDFDDQTRFAIFGQALNRQLVEQLKNYDPKPGAPLHAIGVISSWSAPVGTVRIVPVSWQ